MNNVINAGAGNVFDQRSLDRKMLELDGTKAKWISIDQVIEQEAIMKAFVDQDICIGCGMCEGLCPAVFSIGEDEKAHAMDEEIQEGDLADAESARDSCPVGAITVE